MYFRFTPEQESIRDTARAFLAQHATQARLRETIAAQAPTDEPLWHAITTEMGWPGAAIPEEFGGAGLSAVELAILMQETGAALAAVPFFTTTAMAVPAILHAATHLQKSELLPAIAEGDSATLCFTDTLGTPGLAGVRSELHRHGNAYRLTGQAGFIASAATARHIVVAARAPRSLGEDGISLIALSSDTPGLHRTDHTTLDLTRPYSALTFDNVDVPLDRILGVPESAGAALRHTLAFAATMLAAEQLGGAERLLHVTTEHAKTRTQFNRPIGSFQAVKHMLADMMLRVESARSAAYYAACTAAESPQDLPEVASIARAYCSDAFSHCAADAVQLHGGMGYTWEHPVQLYFKRARASATWLGDAPYHRELVAQSMGLDEAAA
jgi:alkylation response protein AidB-like acyl-CoA dehydrogenase